jgi:hypothetical protein
MANKIPDWINVKFQLSDNHKAIADQVKENLNKRTRLVFGRHQVGNMSPGEFIVEYAKRRLEWVSASEVYAATMYMFPKLSVHAWNSAFLRARTINLEWDKGSRCVCHVANVLTTEVTVVPIEEQQDDTELPPMEIKWRAWKEETFGVKISGLKSPMSPGHSSSPEQPVCCSTGEEFSDETYERTTG